MPEQIIPPLDRELVMAAHDALHKGDTAAAHELLHKALGVDNDAEMNRQIKGLAHIAGFDHAFITACRKHSVRAAYVLIDPVHSTNGRARMISGGDAVICQAMQRIVG